MAMPRSFGSISVTRWRSIQTSPLVTRSSPATIRSRVDLPQPEGPTITINSPSDTSRVRGWIT